MTSFAKYLHRRPARRCVFLVCAAMAASLAWGAPQACLARGGASDYGLKAEFVRNLATFIEWPESAFADEKAPFVIGIVGDDPFGETLDVMVADEYVGKRPIATRRFRRGDDLTECHLLFVGNSEGGALGSIWATLRRRPVLTVGELPGFVQSGGMVGFDLRGGQVVLVVNEAAMREAELKASSKLLEVARALYGTEDAP